MITLTDLWRYPIKAIGRETLPAVDLAPETTFPGDRLWAVAHEAARLSPGWNACGNFARAATAPGLQAVKAQTSPDGAITLAHPDRPDVTLSLPADADALLAWLAPLWPDTRPALSRVVRAEHRGLTDSDTATVSIMNHASRRALSQKCGTDLSAARFRGNLWIDGAAPWEEFDWIGKTVQIGPATLQIIEPITRCKATHASPATGRRDADVLTALDSGWNHQDFGVLARVNAGGPIRIGDEVTLK